MPDRVTDIIKAGLAAGDDFVNGENMHAEGGLDRACNVADRSCENLFGKRIVEVASCYQAKLCVQFGPAQKILRNGGEFLTARHPLERRAGDCRVIKDHLPDVPSFRGGEFVNAVLIGGLDLGVGNLDFIEEHLRINAADPGAAERRRVVT